MVLYPTSEVEVKGQHGRAHGIVWCHSFTKYLLVTYSTLGVIFGAVRIWVILSGNSQSGGSVRQTHVQTDTHT